MEASPITLEILHLSLVVDREIEETATQLREYIGKRFAQYPELHHHLTSNREDKKLLYRYPNIQYNIFNKKAIILGIGKESIGILRKVVMSVEELKLSNNTYKICEINAHYLEPEFGLRNNGVMFRYRFNTPWLALNEKNYENFTNSSLNQRRDLLERIFIGNLISVSKNLGYEVPDTILVEIELYPIKVSFKSVALVGFKGVFETNFVIPDYLGIGKAVSHGFGTVKRITKVS